MARRVAVNFGIRHRRELNKRERWALEQPEVAEEKTGGSNPPCTPELLQRTLAEIPAAHRECLVLFYIEGKSGVEAATRLGISESAFRVRLHRARAILREQLETKLESSLEQLRPSRTLVPAIMLTVLASPSAKAAGGGTVAGVGAKVLSIAGKSFLFAWLAPLIMLLGSLPGIALGMWIGRVERRNYRDPDGFRAQLHHLFFRSFLWGFPALLVALLLINRAVVFSGGLTALWIYSACIVLVTVLVSARQLVINRNPFQIAMTIYAAIVLAGIVALALHWIPLSMAALPGLVGTFFLIFQVRHRPMPRMDYNLFLRATQGMLSVHEGPAELPPNAPLPRAALMAFARFLGLRWMAVNYCWTTSGLALRLPPVRANFLRNFAGAFMPPGPSSSHVLLCWDGNARAHCNEGDAAALVTFARENPINISEMEASVAKVVGSAWREVRNGNPATAGRLLGEVPEMEVFIKPARRAAATRLWQGALVASFLLVCASLYLQWRPPAWLSGLRPVSITERQVRDFLNDTTPNPDPKKFKLSSASLALFTCLALPSTNLFPAEGLHMMRDEISSGSFDKLKTDPMRAQYVYNISLMRRAFADGWLTWSDVDVQPEEVAGWLRDNWSRMRMDWDYMLTHGQSWSWVKEERFNVIRMNSAGVNELRFLQAAGCLDLVEREKLIQKVASIQVLSATSAPGEPPIHDWQDVRGLFFTPCWPALQDTYFSLAALEILGGLDRIDKGECIRGILRVHRGGGFFTSPNSGGFNEYHIEGDARDTFAAYECLRILGALDRVKDLDEWQFRPHHFRDFKGKVIWNDVEAWVCKQRLEKILREHQKNPAAPYGSLSED